MKKILRNFMLCMLILCAFAGAGLISGEGRHKKIYAQSSRRSTSRGAAPRAAAAGEGTPLLILMYHCVSNKNPGKYIIPPSVFEADLKYLTENNYTAVTVADLLAYQESDVALPARPVMLTFDDGNGSDYEYVLPLLKKYGMKAVSSVIGHFIDKNYTEAGQLKEGKPFYLTFEQIAEMNRSGAIEIQNHSYDLHNRIHGRSGMASKRGETYEAYKAVLEADLRKLENRLEERAGVKCTAVAFPFGFYSEFTVLAVKELGYKASFTCTEGVNYIYKDCDLFHLMRYNRPYGLSLGDFLAKKRANY